MTTDTIAVIAVASFVAPVLISYVVEALRRRPTAAARAPWGPGVSIDYANIGGVRVRYLKTGHGPNLVLLHTLRTQVDIFGKIIPKLAEQFTVYACDYPGHGWSDIPHAKYAPEDFYQWIEAFLETVDIDEACVVGLSIGGTIALVLAARQNPRVTSVIAVNPYDYPPAGGIRGSSLVARLILGPAGVPILGATLMRLRNRFVSDAIMTGGVASADAMSPELRAELYEVGERRGHYQAFLSLLAHERRWSEARSLYPQIRVPTLLIYGEQDWAPGAERERTGGLIPGVVVKTVAEGSHFLSLDRPTELTDLIVRFVARTPVPGRARR
ncbi:MAG TPA: alpha/beta hydrolase [Steroidobacteraceae bacterium]|nr:alpha/beta hydrolase [Steroidobacteraceae bacterium]